MNQRTRDKTHQFEVIKLHLNLISDAIAFTARLDDLLPHKMPLV